MPSTRERGQSAEHLVKCHYEAQGYEHLESNYRYGRAEIDLIFLKETEAVLVFVEVKARSRTDFGEPESFVSAAQADRITSAAEDYVYAINWKKDIRFDIASVGAADTLRIFEDAF